MVSIRSDGSAYPCCSLLYKEIPRLKLGNVNEENLHKIIANANKDPLLNLMMVDNISMIFSRARKSMLDSHNNYMAKNITHECEVCKDMLTDESILAELESVAAKKLPKLKKFQKKIYPNIYPVSKS
jgi:hypothetical protein